MHHASVKIDNGPLSAFALKMAPAHDSADSDANLMQRVRRDDEDAFATLVHRYTNVIHAFVFRLCGNQQDAEDFTQETFLRVWRRADRWSPHTSKFSTWLHQVARNVVVDAFRRDRAAKRTKDTFDETPLVDSLDGYEQDNRVNALKHALRNLPERQRTALVLCQVQGWAQDDAAVVLDTTVNGIQALINRARRTLRERLNPTSIDR